MHRKHFILIANILKNHFDVTYPSYELAKDFATLCESENPNFDKEKFYKVCGLVSFDESSM